jgi:hypothetical protein
VLPKIDTVIVMFQSILHKSLRKIVKNVTLNLNAKLNHFLPFSHGGIQSGGSVYIYCMSGI